METWVIPLSEIGREDVDLAGGKGANLGVLVKAGMRVPSAFVITAPAYLGALEHGGVRERVRQLTAAVDASDAAALSRGAREVQVLVREVPLPDDLVARIRAAYRDIGGPDLPVAVRSSATAEDSKDTSFAGMNATLTNVVGDDALVSAVRECWASLFGERVISYRASQGIDAEPALAVVVQAMVDSQRSGVMFTADPSTADSTRIVIEAALGLGEVVVGGAVEPDTYVLDKAGPRLVSVRVGHQDIAVVRGPDGGDMRIELDDERADQRVLTDDEIVDLARTGLAIDAHYGEPQDIEWAVSDEGWFILQSRPITTLAGAATVPAGTADALILLQGQAASPGVVCGPVRVLAPPDEGATLVGGEVLVAVMTSPDWVPTIKRAAALVTDGGGMTCHAAIVARELRVPCIVGTRDATKVLRDGQVVTVDATEGRVGAGDVVSGSRAVRWTKPGNPSRPKARSTRSGRTSDLGKALKAAGETRASRRTSGSGTGRLPTSMSDR